MLEVGATAPSSYIMKKRNNDEFTRLERTSNKKRWFEQCNKCAEAHNKAPDDYPPPEVFKGRREKYVSHRESCPHNIAATKLVPARQQAAPSDWDASTVATFHRLLVEFQHSLKLPDTFIVGRPTTRLLEFLCQSISMHVPSRKYLGGDLLAAQAKVRWDQDKAKLLEKVTDFGGRVNLLMDAWQNISHDHLNACQLSLDGQVHTFTVQALTARHDGLKIAEALEGVIGDAVKQLWVIGAVVTDNAGQCGLARRILAKRWPNIVFMFCFAHAINNLVKAVLKSTFTDVATKAAQAVHCLIASSAKWLVRAKHAMKRKYCEVLNFMSLCETRWNSVQACFASLLRVKSSPELFWWEWQADKEYSQQLQVLGDKDFWRELKEAEEVIRPLSRASYILQRDQNTVADVVYCFGEIYDGFASNPTYGEKLVTLLEKRWSDCEQPLLMLGYYLHPRYSVEAKQLPCTALSTLGNIADDGVYYYRRLFQTETIGRLRPHLTAWFAGRLTSTDARLYTSKPLEYWADVRAEKPKSLLPALASAVLSIAVNTATCERLFSELALIHTTTRNRMRAKKALDIHVVRKHLREEDEAAINPQVQLRIIDPKERAIVTVAQQQTEETTTTQPRAESEEAESQPHMTHAESEGAAESMCQTSETEQGDEVDALPEVDAFFWEELVEEILDVDMGEEMESGSIHFDSDSDGGDEQEEDEATRFSSELDSEDDEDSVPRLNALEVIPKPKGPVFPATKQTFPQEKKLKGIRATKVALGSLFEQRRKQRLQLQQLVVAEVRESH